MVGLDGESTEARSLVAGAGKVSDASQLAGWTVLGIPAYSPAFVRGNILGTWGALPPDMSLEFTRRVLGEVRRAAGGENVAVILDGVQTAALAELPNASGLEIVATSDRLPLGLVVTVGGRLDPAKRDALLRGLTQAHTDPGFAAVLSTVRVTGFGPVDTAALGSIREAFALAH